MTCTSPFVLRLCDLQLQRADTGTSVPSASSKFVYVLLALVISRGMMSAVKRQVFGARVRDDDRKGLLKGPSHKYVVTVGFIERSLSQVRDDDRKGLLKGPSHKYVLQNKLLRGRIPFSLTRTPLYYTRVGAPDAFQ